MSENNAERLPQIRQVEVEEVRKSLDSFEVAPPVPVEVPAPSAPAVLPQDSAPADFDG
jgi:hypothetical protein